MKDYPDALLAIEYRPELKEVVSFVETLPEDFYIKMLEALQSEPGISADILENKIREEYNIWKNPFDSPELNAGLERARELHEDAAAEFERVVKTLGDSVNVASVLAHLEERYRPANDENSTMNNSAFSPHDDVGTFTTNSTKNTFDTGHWVPNPVIPWRRYFARMFDTLFNGMVLVFLIGIAAFQVAPYDADKFFSNINPLVETMLTAFLGCIGSGIILGFTGTTLGKWIFGVRVLTLNGQNIGVIAGIQRDFQVWIRGFGLGIPLITLITLILSYKSLTTDKVSVWDKDRYCVIHRPSGPFQYFLNAVGIMLFFSISVIARMLGEM